MSVSNRKIIQTVGDLGSFPGSFRVSDGSRSGQLDTGGHAFTPSPQKKAENRWKLADTARHSLISNGVESSIRACGFAAYRSHAVTFRCESVENHHRIAVDGVSYCGSVRCPRCAPVRASAISERVSKTLEAAYNGGFSVAMMTLTIRHDRKTALSDERRVMTDAFQALQRGGLYRRLKRDGLAGLVRVPEVTWGARTGWHLHIHTLVIMKGDAVAAGRFLVDRWLHLVQVAGFSAALEGQDVRPINRDSGLGDYGVKGLRSWGPALEMAGQWVKTGKRPGRMGVAELLALSSEGDKLAGAKYAEAVRDLKGMRCMTIGPALKRVLGLTFEDPADEEAVEVETQEGEVLGSLQPNVWILAAKKGARSAVLKLIFLYRDRPWHEIKAYVEILLSDAHSNPDQAQVRKRFLSAIIAARAKTRALSTRSF